MLAAPALLWLLSPLSVEAQALGAHAVPGATFERYVFSDAPALGVRTLTVATLPFAAGVPLGSRGRVTVRGALATSTLTAPDGEELTLSGPTDIELASTWTLIPDAVNVEVLAHLPTGKSSLDPDEATVGRAVADALLPLQLSHWGTGGAIVVGISGARRTGRVGLGAAASYRTSRAYEPLKDVELRYEPGDEIGVRAALDYEVGRAAKLSLAVGFRRFGDDIGNDQGLFRTGNSFDLVGTYGFPVGPRGAGAVYAGVIGRKAGSFLDRPEGGVGSQRLLMAGGLVTLPLRAYQLLARMDGRAFRPEDGAGRGWLVGADASIELPLGPTTLLPTAGLRLGGIAPEEGESASLTGFALGVSARVGGGRRSPGGSRP